MKLFERITRRRLGATKRNVQRVLQEADKTSPVDQTAVEVLTMEVINQLRTENPQEYCEAEDDGFDWEAFYEFIMKLVEMLIPLIIKNRPQTTTV